MTRTPTDMVVDIYALFGVDPRASITEIKKAYRRFVSSNHPDKHDGFEARAHAHEWTVRANRAFEVLSDSEKRRAYDGERATRAEAQRAATRAAERRAAARAAEQRAAARRAAEEAKRQREEARAAEQRAADEAAQRAAEAAERLAAAKAEEARQRAAGRAAQHRAAAKAERARAKAGGERLRAAAEAEREPATATATYAPGQAYAAHEVSARTWPMNSAQTSGSAPQRTAIDTAPLWAAVQKKDVGLVTLITGIVLLIILTFLGSSSQTGSRGR